MENKFKSLANEIILDLFKTDKHDMECIEKETISILALKMKMDADGINYFDGNLNDNTDSIKVIDEVTSYVTEFRKHFKFIITNKDYEKITSKLKEICTKQIKDISLNYIQSLVKTIMNNEINNQMSKVMNAVKGLRQDLYQNDFCTGQPAYRETVRILFLKMIEDKEVKTGALSKQFYDFNIKNFKENVSFYKDDVYTKTGITVTETDYLNNIFKKDVLDLDHDAPFAIYKDLFRPTEELVSSPQMIFKFIQKIEDVDFVDLMDYGKDILGIVYEQFIGEVQNSKAGQIFTPTDVVEFMTDIAELSMDDICLDFCSGSGRFMTSAMRKMIDDVKNNVSDEEEREQKIEFIKHNQVFGADIGADPALNTKRNMALAGDGSSHVANMNSLFIQTEQDGKYTISTFINGKGVNKAELVGNDGKIFEIKNCSCILTNPPFGDLTLNETYDEVWIDTMRETFNKACVSELKRWKPKFEEIVNQIGTTDSETLKDMFDELLDIAPLDRNSDIEKALAKINKAIEKSDKKIIKKEIEIILTKGVRSVSTQYKIKKGVKILDGRKDFKGCLMFLYKAYQILKVGGRCLIVVDDGVLNTDTYAFARDFIRNKFFIKSVFSLSDKAFYAHSDKMIKTSILYLEKKPESVDEYGDIVTEKQTDPVFYAHIEKTGQNSKRGKYESHFNQIKQGYFDFVKKVKANKEGNYGVFSKETFNFEEVAINTEAPDEEDMEVEANE